MESMYFHEKDTLGLGVHKIIFKQKKEQALKFYTEH